MTKRIRIALLYLYQFGIVGFLFGIFTTAILVTALSRYTSLPYDTRIHVGLLIPVICALWGAGMGLVFFRRNEPNYV